MKPLTPEAKQLRDQMERLKADYTVLKRQRQKFQQEADKLFDLQAAADEESARKQDAVDASFGSSLVIKQARKEALKRANAKFRAAYKDFARAIHRRDKAEEQMLILEDEYLEAGMRLEELGYPEYANHYLDKHKNPMQTRKGTTKKTIKARKPTKKTAAKKRNRTVIKAKRVTVLSANPKRKPAKKAAKKRTSKRRNAPEYSSATPISVTHHYRSGGPGYASKRERIIKMGQRDLFAQDATVDQLLGYLRKKNPTLTSLTKKRLGKQFETASPSLLRKTMAAILREEKAKRAGKTTRKPASKKRRNPNATEQAKQQFREFHGHEPRGLAGIYVPTGTPDEGLSVLGTFNLVTLTNGQKITPAKTCYLLRDLKGKLHLGTTAKGHDLTNLPKGNIGEVAKIEYIARKPHVGHPQRTIWFHKAGEENGIKPTLASDGQGGLVFKGGDYYITPEGIRN